MWLRVGEGVTEGCDGYHLPALHQRANDQHEVGKTMNRIRFRGAVYRLATALPRVLYHGTTEMFQRFDPARIGRRDSGNLGTGVYLTDDPHFAMRYAEDNAEKFGGIPVVLEVHHHVENVATYTDYIRDIKTELGAASAAYKGKDFSDKLRDFFLNRGYDAAVMGSEIVVYKPELLSIVGKANVLSTNEHLKELYHRKMRELGREP